MPARSMDTVKLKKVRRLTINAPPMIYRQVIAKVL